MMICIQATEVTEGPVVEERPMMMPHSLLSQGEMVVFSGRSVSGRKSAAFPRRKKEKGGLRCPFMMFPLKYCGKYEAQ